MNIILKLWSANILTKISNNVSRSKTLLKRRKITIKKRPMSKKRLVEEAKKMNATRQFRAVQLRRQLDKKKQINYNLYELMNEIYYPDIRTQSYISAQIANQPKPYNNLEVTDQISKNINAASLATELLEVFIKYADNQLSNGPKLKLQVQHYKLILERINYYLTNLNRIKKHRLEKWQRMMKKVKDPQNKKPKCPLIFLDSQDLVKYPPMVFFIDTLFNKIKQNDNHKLLDQIEIGILLYEVFNFIPVKIFNTIKFKIYIQSRQTLSLNIKKSILKFFSLKTQVKLHRNIIISHPNNIVSDFEKQLQFVRSISIQILNDQQHNASDLITIIQLYETKIPYLTKQILKISETSLYRHITKIPFQKQIVLMDAFLNLSSSSYQIIQLLKYDLYRKCEQSSNPKSILQAISFIKEQKIYSQNVQHNQPTNYLIGYDLLIKLANKISKFLASNSYSSSQLVFILNQYYINSFSEIIHLQLISNQLVKKYKSFTLQQLAQTCFKINLLGYSSSVYAQLCFKQFVNHYHQRLKQYKEQRIIYLPTNENLDETIMPHLHLPSLKEVNLQELMVSTLWCYVHSNQKLNIDQILKIYPISSQIISHHHTIYELINNCHHKLQKYGVFSPIKKYHQKNSINSQKQILQSYKKHSIFTKLIKPYYIQNSIEILIKKEAEISKQFQGNYHIKWNKYLPQRWSEQNLISIDQYALWVQKQQINNNNNNKSYFSDSQCIILSPQFCQERFRIVSQYLKSQQMKSSQKENLAIEELKPKLYNLNQ